VGKEGKGKGKRREEKRRERRRRERRRGRRRGKGRGKEGRNTAFLKRLLSKNFRVLRPRTPPWGG